MLRTHRQRVPAMLVVACVGMMVYAAAGAAPGDGTELAAAPTATTAKDGKGSTTGKCGGSTPTTRDDDGKGSTTSTTEKDDDGKGSTTSTTEKDDDGKGSTTSTTDKDDSKDGDDKDSTNTRDKTDVKTAAAVKGDTDKGTTGTTAKGGSGDDDCKEPTTSTTRKDREPTTSTTEKDGRDKTTTTTRKGSKDGDGKGTTTTTDRRDRDRPTTTTTERPDTVHPTTPSGGSGDPDSGGSPDPGATPIEPQEAPPYDPGYSEEPVDDPGDFDPEAMDEGEYYDMPEDGPFAEDDEFAFGPIASPGAPQPVFPTFSDDSSPRSRGKAAGSSDRADRRRNRDRDQELAAPPMVVSSSGALQASAGLTESAAVSRRLGGVQTSAMESAFPADIISTPKVFPINRRDPLAAAALVLLVGVSRELFKAWRRKATDYWPA